MCGVQSDLADPSLEGQVREMFRNEENVVRVFYSLCVLNT